MYLLTQLASKENYHALILDDHSTKSHFYSVRFIHFSYPIRPLPQLAVSIVYPHLSDDLGEPGRAESKSRSHKSTSKQ